MGEVVTFDPSSNFKKDLLDASRRNDKIEVKRIIEILNERIYTNIDEISIEIMRLVNELDPFDVHSTVETIFNGLHPDNMKLFEPVNVITSSVKYKKRSFGCFS